ncbi:C2 domain in Dock180 and Zizimin proteins-domain-containing protein [Mycena galopus ATCC 62051]|nr:C2 domain in Dock180 and Zizimin proteins-domain-containing protein [Mycena galopus ATCC 62051]
MLILCGKQKLDRIPSSPSQAVTQDGGLQRLKEAFQLLPYSLNYPCVTAPRRALALHRVQPPRILQIRLRRTTVPKTVEQETERENGFEGSRTRLDEEQERLDVERCATLCPREFSDAEGRLPDLATTLNGVVSNYAQSSNGWASQNASHGTASPGSSFVQWTNNKGPGSTMGSLKEEDEDADLSASRKSFRTGSLPDLAKSIRTGIPAVYPASLRSASVRSSSPADSQEATSAASVPQVRRRHRVRRCPADHRLKLRLPCANGTPSCSETRLQTLPRCAEHIEALHLGRRQLLAQTLNFEETVSMRRDCVTRLVSGNIVQGLDVIIRHPTWGALVTVDVEGDIDQRSWVSAVRMYSMQTALAYTNVSYPEFSLPHAIGASPDFMAAGPLPTPVHSVFPESSYHKPRSLSLGSPNDPRPTTAKFFPHLPRSPCVRRVAMCAWRNSRALLLPVQAFRTICDRGILRHPQPQRRPFGCAVLELTQLARMAAEDVDVTPAREHQMHIYTPTNEASFSMIHQNIISKNSKEYEKISRADMLAVTIKIFRDDAPTLVRENTSLLQDMPHTLRLGFPDVVFPGDVRNELYIKLWSGEFTPTNMGSGRLSVAQFARGQMAAMSNNVQVTVEVRDQNGQTVETVISQGSGEPLMTQFHSMVFQRCNESTFGELIKVQLPPQGIPLWHLFITFRNRSGTGRGSARGNTDNFERPFAFAFQPLFPDKRAFVEDGSHTQVLYRADKMSQISSDIYLTAPSWMCTKQWPEQLLLHPEMLRLAPPLRNTLTLRSSLCSTKFTQNAVLLSLLSWDQLADRELLSTVLTKFTFVGEGEIVKFLRDIFDSLFGILVSQNNQSGEMDGLVFNALITVLGIVQDRRFSNFQPVLDVYIEQHFSCAAASSHMIHSMTRLLANPTSTESASPLRAALKVWHYIFKFIARSRELQKAKELGMGGGATADHLESTFKRELRSHLAEVTRMIASTSPPSIIGMQTIALQHFTFILPELSKIFSTVELVSIATSFANAVTVGKGKIVIWKLIMYLQIVKGFLFDNPESRPLLVEAVVIWIKPHFGRYDEYHSNELESAKDAARVSWLESIRLCVTIVAVMLDKLQQNLVDPAIVVDRNRLRKEQDNVENLLPLISHILPSYTFAATVLRQSDADPTTIRRLSCQNLTTIRRQSDDSRTTEFQPARN